MNINFTAPINDRSYGICGLNLATELVKAGNDVALFPIGQVSFTNKEAAIYLQNSYINQESYDKNAPSIKLWHQFDLAQHVGKGLHVGFPIFELDNFNKRELHHLNSQDLLLAPTDWAKKILEEKTNVDVKCVPLGVDIELFRPLGNQIDNVVSNKTDDVLFLNIGKIEVRKGHDVLISAFCDAFESNDRVRLLVSWANPFLSEDDVKEWEKLYKDSKLGDKVIFVPWLPTQEALAGLINSVDCGVFPSRAEGWNLPALEMLACGKDVIATNFSGHTEFLTDENAYLIDIDEVESAYDGKWFFEQGNWASFGEKQHELLVHYFRVAYKKHLEYKEKKERYTNLAGLDTAQMFSWSRSATKLVEVISNS